MDSKEVMRLIDRLISSERQLAEAYRQLSDFERERVEALTDFRIFWMREKTQREVIEE